jgi:hypothetical protein
MKPFFILAHGVSSAKDFHEFELIHKLHQQVIPSFENGGGFVRSAIHANGLKYTDPVVYQIHLAVTFKNGQYRIIRKLGDGSFIVVWLAFDN